MKVQEETTMTVAAIDTAEVLPFDLNDKIRDLYERTHIADPGEFADALLGGLPAQYLREVARISMREYVRVWFSRERLRHPVPRLVGEEIAPSPGRVNQRYLGLAEALLRQSVSLKGDKWQEFGACTPADLDFLISARKENAERSLAKAKFYQRVKREVMKHGAARVADLPRDVLHSLAVRGDDK